MRWTRGAIGRIISEWPTSTTTGTAQLQDRFDTRRLADRIEERLCHDALRRRRPSVHRGARHVLPRDRRRERPCRSAPTRAASRASSGSSTSTRSPSRATTATACTSRSGTFSRNPQVGILFIDFTSPKRLRVNGIASIDDDDPLLAECTGAQLIVRVRATARAAELLRATCTGWSSSSGRASSRTTTTRRRSPAGSGASGRGTCSLPGDPANAEVPPDG